MVLIPSITALGIVSLAYVFVFGAPFAPEVWQDRDLKAWEVTARIGGRPEVRGVGANVLGDPWEALSWLVNECSSYGMPLLEGQVISTGTCVVPVAVTEGETLEADYGTGEGLRVSFA